VLSIDVMFVDHALLQFVVEALVVLLSVLLSVLVAVQLVASADALLLE